MTAYHNGVLDDESKMRFNLDLTDYLIEMPEDQGSLNDLNSMF